MILYIHHGEDAAKKCAYHWCTHPDRDLQDEPLAVPITLLVFTVLMHPRCFRHWVLMGVVQDNAHLN